MKKSNITRAIKYRRGASPLVECQVDGGTAYVSNGFVLLCIAPEAHDNLIKPITGADAGNYRFQGGQVGPSSTGLHELFKKHVEKVLHDAGLLENPGMTIQDGGTCVAGLYNLVKGFPVLVDACYLAAFPDDAMLWACSPIDPVIVTDGMHNLLGLIMPIKPRFDNFQRAVKSYYTPAEEQPEPSRSAAEWMEAAEKLEAERNAAEQEIASLREQLNAANHAAAVPVAQDPASNAAETVDAIVSRFTSIPGIIATVKGAQTAAPVVWLSGDVEAQADTIKQQGGKWSAKRSAYYFRVA